MLNRVVDEKERVEDEDGTTLKARAERSEAAVTAASIVAAGNLMVVVVVVVGRLFARNEVCRRVCLTRTTTWSEQTGFCAFVICGRS